jgi:hypothetical protein
MKKYLMVAALTGLALPSEAFAQAGSGTGTGGGAGGHGLGPNKPIVLQVWPGTLDDLARTKTVNGVTRLRKTRNENTNEMSDVTVLGDGRTALFIEMRTGSLDDGTKPDHRVQVACAPISITQNAATGAVALQKLPGERFVTNNDGEDNRNGNVPNIITVNGGKNALLMFNYRPRGTNNTRRYAKVLDAACNEVPLTNANGQTRTQVLIMEKDNDDCDMHQSDGPGRAVVESAGSSNVTLWAGCNGNGEDKGWVNNITVKFQNDATGLATSAQIIKNFDVALAQREERSRGHVSLLPDGNTIFATWTEGNNQPQRDGTWMAAVDISPSGDTGADVQSRVLWKTQFDGRKQVAATVGNGNQGDQNLNNGKIRTYSVRMAHQQIVTEAADGSVTPTDMFIVQSGDANGRNNNNHKGGTYRQLQMAVVQASRSGATYVVPKTDVTNTLAGIDGTHLLMLPAMFGGGTDLIPGVTFLQGSHNGGGIESPQLKGLGVDLVSKTFVDLGTRQAGGSYDRALYSNYLGQNPGNQGRNYAGGILIKNPFASQTGQVSKYFVVNALTGKAPENVDNAAIKPASYLTLVEVATTMTRTTHALRAEENESSGCTAVSGKAGWEGLLMLAGCLALMGIARRRRA